MGHCEDVHGVHRDADNSLNGVLSVCDSFFLAQCISGRDQGVHESMKRFQASICKRSTIGYSKSKCNVIFPMDFLQFQPCIIETFFLEIRM